MKQRFKLSNYYNNNFYQSNYEPVKNIKYQLNDWTTSNQKAKNYCLVATICDNIFYLTNKKIDQHEIAQMCGFAEHGVPVLTGYNVLKKLLNEINYPIFYYLNHIPLNYANSEHGKWNDQLYFQYFVTDSLSNGNPIILIINGTAPWWISEEQIIWHAVNLISIEIVDDNPGNTIYGISETDGTVPGRKGLHTFKGDDLGEMFINGLGATYSQSEGYNFITKKLK